MRDLKLWWWGQSLQLGEAILIFIDPFPAMPAMALILGRGNRAAIWFGTPAVGHTLTPTGGGGGAFTLCPSREAAVIYVGLYSDPHVPFPINLSAPQRPPPPAFLVPKAWKRPPQVVLVYGLKCSWLKLQPSSSIKKFIQLLNIWAKKRDFAVIHWGILAQIEREWLNHLREEDKIFRDPPALLSLFHFRLVFEGIALKSAAMLSPPGSLALRLSTLFIVLTLTSAAYCQMWLAVYCQPASDPIQGRLGSRMQLRQDDDSKEGKRWHICTITITNGALWDLNLRHCEYYVSHDSVCHSNVRKAQ